MEDIQRNNQNILLIGSGELAREIVSWNSLSKERMDFLGYIDNFTVSDKLNLNYLGSYDKISSLKDCKLILAMSNCIWKEEFILSYLNYELLFTSFIHETCLIGKDAIYGKGLILFPYTVLSCDAKVGDFVFINNGSQIGHDAIIGEFSSIMANVDIGGGAKIGKKVFVGSGATILPRVSIPDNTIIGAGSVVFKSIKVPGTYIGNPAKRIF